MTPQSDADLHRIVCRSRVGDALGSMLRAGFLAGERVRAAPFDRVEIEMDEIVVDDEEVSAGWREGLNAGPGRTMIEEHRIEARVFDRALEVIVRWFP